MNGVDYIVELCIILFLAFFSSGEILSLSLKLGWFFKGIMVVKLRLNKYLWISLFNLFHGNSNLYSLLSTKSVIGVWFSSNDMVVNVCYYV